MESAWRYCDGLGPEKILYLHDATVGLKAILVVDNVAAGPSIGGARMAPDVSLEECSRLARAMTLKNAAAGLPHGGGKSVIFADPKMKPRAKESLVRAFACALRDIEDYIVGPDMGTDEQCMAWVHDEIGRAVGLPPEIGGIPLDAIGATGYGLSIAAEVAQEFCDVRLDGARVVVQGFGSVGTHAARFLADKGAKLIAASDSRGAVLDRTGLPIDRLIAHKMSGRGVAEFEPGEPIDGEALIGLDCDLWIPAARPDVINAGNADRLRARLVVSGANIAITGDAEQSLADRGVLVVPDFIANAGGVICASVEYHGGTQGSAFDAIEEKIRANTQAVLREADTRGITPTSAAKSIAESRVNRAMQCRRWGPRNTKA